MTSTTFLRIGNLFTKATSSSKVNLKLFKSFFGIIPTVCSKIWGMIQLNAPTGSKPEHLLWCLYFFKQYNTENTRRTIFNADEKIIRKWTWIFVDILSNLDVMQWNSRFDSLVAGQSCSLDGVDFQISEPFPFNRRWFSHKFKGPGLRYEIGLNIRTGDIVWKNCGYPCGEYPDLRLAREAYTSSVNSEELTIADKGYNDKKYFILPNENNKRVHKLIMSRHETVNKRIKQFNILKHVYRHPTEKHPMVFHAVVNLTQMMIKHGEPLFSVAI